MKKINRIDEELDQRIEYEFRLFETRNGISKNRSDHKLLSHLDGVDWEHLKILDKFMLIELLDSYKKLPFSEIIV